MMMTGKVVDSSRGAKGQTLKTVVQVAIADKDVEDNHNDDAKTTCGGGNSEDFASSCYC